MHISRSLPGFAGKKMIVAAAAIVAAGLANRALAANGSLGDVFVIALENHNFTQPNTITSPQQLYGNPAAPYLNSLITPGNPNAAQVSYATNYTNAGNGVHPSEPNYVWQEAGSNLGNSTDNDPATTTNPPTLYTPAMAAANTSTNAANWYSNPTLTDQLTGAGLTWKNYQEDVQYSTAPTKSASGTGGTAPSGQTVTTNPYYGTTQYNYAVKHNPMAFFPTSANSNVYPIAQLSTDLTNNTVGAYNWITPNQYNDMHSALSGGFTYNGTHYTGDQASVAQGDNFLSIVVPLIEASQAYKNNGAIVIWNDETEGGDGLGETSTEIVISPLAKGNAYASNVALNHTSDIQTIEELYGLGSLTNPIQANAYAAGSTAQNPVYNADGSVNDLSSLFVAGAVPEPSSLALAGIAGCALLRRRARKA
jgi:hypothetical protein